MAATVTKPMKEWTDDDWQAYWEAASEGAVSDKKNPVVVAAKRDRRIAHAKAIIDKYAAPDSLALEGYWPFVDPARVPFQELGLPPEYIDAARTLERFLMRRV